MQDKISTQREAITQRDNEIIELRDKITQRANEATDLRRVLDGLALDQKELVEEKQVEEQELDQLREIRQLRKDEADGYSDRLRKVKQQAFQVGEKADQILKVREAKKQAREALEQDLMLAVNKLKHNQSELNELQVEKRKLDTVCQEHEQDLVKLDNQRKLLYEHNRRL